MPQLYPLSNVSPPHLSFHTLHLTHVLLRKQHSHLASQIHELLTHLESVCATGQTLTETTVESFCVLHNLGAPTIGKIISALTQMGNHWLHSPTTHSDSLCQLQTILQQWIELGDWVVLQSSGY